MRTICAAISFVLLTSISSAASVTLNPASKTVQRPGSGTIIHSITGHVSLGPDEGNPIATIGEDAYTADLSNWLSPSIAPQFSAFMSNAQPGQSYDGPLLTVPITSATALGDYAYTGGPYTPFFYFGYDVIDTMFGGILYSDYFKVGYSITVNPVPEPAMMAALGFGALAMVRRRKRA